MKRALGILAFLAMTTSGFAQQDSITRPVQDMGGDGSVGLYGTPDQFALHPNDTLRSHNGNRKQSATQNQNTTQTQFRSQTPDPVDGTVNRNDRYRDANRDEVFASETPRRNQGSDPFFTFGNGSEPKKIGVLGTNPEFPFLAHLSSSKQVYNAMSRHSDNSRLNNIIMSLGYTNGIQDLQASNITAATIPGGTTGNMGAGNMKGGYYKLIGDNGFKAWKVTGNNGDYVFFLQACGNEFYPQPGKPGGTACINAPINITADPVTITANGRQTQVTDKIYVYYHKRKHRKYTVDYTNSELTDKNASRPLLLSTRIRNILIPETYNVTLSTQTTTEMVCPDSIVNVPASINIEKTSTYTGNYPDRTTNTYKMVSKREYMRADRKMRKAERKEEKVARLTDTKIDIAEIPKKA